MRLSEVIDGYVEFKRGLGMVLKSEAQALKSFARAMGDIDISGVRTGRIESFFRQKKPVAATLKQYYCVMRSFYRYAVSRGFVAKSPLPDPDTLPKGPPPPEPHIYTIYELRSLLKATETLCSKRAPWRAYVFRVFLLLLYGTGLRLSEALSLTLRDVDVDGAVITVRRSKFKTRLVPTGPKLTNELRKYREFRCHRQPMPNGEDSALFATMAGLKLSSTYAEELFGRLRKQANVARHDGLDCSRPRIHDIRHTAAQHRIEAWYRDRKDVQQLLPKLATFLGHKDVASLRIYLHMTPELLRSASQRFQKYAGV
jgi:integrase/recombinase XerD